MKPQFHILNGDSLKEKFPESIEGSIIIARECLVDGDVNGDSLEALYHTRAKFLSDNYGGEMKDYYQKTVPEFEKILNISKGAEINLWFEDDLFCQVNLWFVINLLNISNQGNAVYLLRPENQLRYGFGGLDNTQLISIYKNRSALEEIDKLSKLWPSYQNNDTEYLLKLAEELQINYPFLLPAVEAHIERTPHKNNQGRPRQSLIQIMKDLETEDFSLVFKEFSIRESIYGFGDLQVRRLFEALSSN